MATTDANSKTTTTSTTLQVEQELEGDITETTDYFFSKIGEPLPLISDQNSNTTNTSPFDLSNPPSSPLVVSERSSLLFVAHSSGFYVAKTKDVIASAKEIKEKGSGRGLGLSVQELCVVDVPIGRVYILALSPDSEFLAAVVGCEIHCFSVNSLLSKDHKPVFSCSVESNYVKDMFWNKGMEASYVALTDNGKLYLGALHKPLKYVLDEIDAVGRSIDGNLLAVARKDILSIFSTKLEEILRVSLPLDSWMGDGIGSCSVKVDSIRWIRSNTIVVGCLQQTEDSKEENYFVQVITSKDSNFIDGSAKLVALSFSDVFPGIVDDIVPFGCGPHLLVNYLEHCGVAFVSNRKNTDQHIILFAWSQENDRVSMVDIERDNWLPRIELQENGDDNLVLGLCIDITSVSENVFVKIGEEQRELSPHCVLVCLTLEGKLIMFDFSSIAGPQISSLASSAPSDDGQNVPMIGPSDHGEAPSLLEEESKKQSALCLGSYDTNANKIDFGLNEVPVKKDLEPSVINDYVSCATSSDLNLRKEPNSVYNKEKVLGDVETCKPYGLPVHSSQGSSSQLSFTNSHVRSLHSVARESVGTDKWKNEHQISSTQSTQKTIFDTGKSMVEKTGSGISQGTSDFVGSSSFLARSDVSSARSPMSLPSATKSTIPETTLASKDTGKDAGRFLKDHSQPSNSFTNSLGKGLNHWQKAVISNGVSETPPGISSSKVQSQDVPLQNSSIRGQPVNAEYKNSSCSWQLNSEQRSTKQFGNVKNMADELDRLLERIEEAGGFRDSCTAAHIDLLETLEDGMNSLSVKSRVWQNVTEERLREIQLLLDKTVQVLARKTHMEGIIRQTTDGKYWDLWNRQKLSSELDLKQQNVLHLSQDLINQMIGLEKHFNALELNLFGESSALNVVSQPLQCRNAQSRYIQSLHAIHKAMVSQLASAQQLAEFLSRQMTVLSIKSPPTKQENFKKQLFESIGMSDQGDYLDSPNTGKMVDSSSSKKLLASCSDAVYDESKRNKFSSVSSHDPETARRRRDSLDRNWANFEAPKTTVKRMMVRNQHQNVSGSFSSPDKQLVSPCKLEGLIASYPMVLSEQDRSGCTDTSKKYNSVASSGFKWAGEIPVKPQVEAKRSPSLQSLKGSSYSAIQKSPLSAPLSWQSSFMDLNTKENVQPFAGRPGAETINTSNSASKDIKPSGFQFGHEKSTIQRMQPQPLSSPIKYSEMPISFSKETTLTKPVGGGSSSTLDSVSSSSSGSQSISTSFGSPSPLPALSEQTLPTTTKETGFISTATMTKDANNQVPQLPSSSFSASSSLADVKSSSFKCPTIIDSHSAGSSISSIRPSKIGSQSTSNEIGADTNLTSTLQPPQKSEPSANDGLNSKCLTPSVPSSPYTREDSSGSSHALSGTASLASDMVSSAQSEKKSGSSVLPPTSFSDSGGGKSTVDAEAAQEDEMEEEAPETNQTADLSLGSLAGFGIGSMSSATASSSRSNPFGVLPGTSTNMSSSVSLTVPSGELFRPASFSFQSLQTSQQSQPAPTLGIFGSGNPPQQSPSGSRFGQPGQIGLGQQALGSVLGSFGQSRQLGATALPGSGFGGTQSSAGFQNAASGGGFASVAPTGGGFAGIGTTASGGGFASIAPTGGGFAGIGTTASGFAGAGAGAAAAGGGFAAMAASGHGFAGAASTAGGFGAFSKQGAGGFSALGSGGAGGRQPPSELFTQMRR